MLRRTFLAASISLALSGLAGSARVHAQGSSVRGTLDQVNTAQGSIVVRTSEGPRSGRITPQTMIVAGGMPGDLRDLRPGQQVVVQFAVSQGGAARLDVIRIEIRG